MVVEILGRHGPGEIFSPSSMAAAINRSFEVAAKRPVQARQVSHVLRRMAASGALELVQKGRPSNEGLYRRR
jgi:CRP-like cAMP-binding protein